MRMKFTRAEREAFTVGAEVEIRNGRYWYPAVVTDTVGRKGTVQVGDVWGPGPTHIRVPAPEPGV